MNECPSCKRLYGHLAGCAVVTLLDRITLLLDMGWTPEKIHKQLDYMTAHVERSQTYGRR